MKKIFSSLIKNQSGQGVLAIVLILVFLGSMILGPLLAFMGTGLKVGQMHETKEMELYAADAGVEDAINWLIHGKPTTDGDWGWSEEGEGWKRDIDDINDEVVQNVDVTVEALAKANTYNVTSTARSPDGSTTVLSTVWAIHIIEGTWDPDKQGSPYEGDVYVDGDVDTGAWVEIIGDVYVTGDLDLHNQSSI